MLLGLQGRKIMLQDFNRKKTLEELRESRRLAQEYKNVSEKLERKYGSVDYGKAKIERLEEEKAKALVVQQKIGILSKLASFFHKGKYYEVNQQIETYEKELSTGKKEWENLNEEKEKLEESKKELGAKKEAKKMPECLREVNGTLVITDEDVGLGEDCLEQNASQVDSKAKVLVHCTNFFPKDKVILSSYDGGKLNARKMEYHGVKKRVNSLHHRHEVHFTMNNRVENTSAGEGNWDSPTYMIIERYDVHQDEMERISPSDAWTKGTSMQLSDDAVILVKWQARNHLPIPDEDREKYPIIYYDGDPTTCLRNFLRLNNYDIVKTERNDPSHSCSSRALQENGLNNRDFSINFMKDNTFFSKELPILSKEEMAQITDIGKTSAPFIMSGGQEYLCLKDKDISEDKQETYFKVANFVISSGAKKTGDGRYTFKSDEEVLKEIEELKDNPEILPTCMDIDLVDEIFKMQQQVAEQYANMPRPALEQIKGMSLQDLYQFKNQLACETVQETLEENTEMIAKNDVIVLKIFENYDSETENKMRNGDEIRYQQLGMQFQSFEKNLDKASIVGNIGKSFDDFRKQIEEIKERTMEELSKE